MRKRSPTIHSRLQESSKGRRFREDNTSPKYLYPLAPNKSQTQASAGARRAKRKNAKPEVALHSRSPRAGNEKTEAVWAFRGATYNPYTQGSKREISTLKTYLAFRPWKGIKYGGRCVYLCCFGSRVGGQSSDGHKIVGTAFGGGAEGRTVHWESGVYSQNKDIGGWSCLVKMKKGR